MILALPPTRGNRWSIFLSLRILSKNGTNSEFKECRRKTIELTSWIVNDHGDHHVNHQNCEVKNKAAVANVTKVDEAHKVDLNI